MIVLVKKYIYIILGKKNSSIICKISNYNKPFSCKYENIKEYKKNISC